MAGGAASVLGAADRLAVPTNPGPGTAALTGTTGTERRDLTAPVPARDGEEPLIIAPWLEPLVGVQTGGATLPPETLRVGVGTAGVPE